MDQNVNQSQTNVFIDFYSKVHEFYIKIGLCLFIHNEEFLKHPNNIMIMMKSSNNYEMHYF